MRASTFQHGLTNFLAQVKAGTEGCDDGNRVDGDGCSSACAIENFYVCNSGAACSNQYALPTLRSAEKKNNQATQVSPVYKYSRSLFIDIHTDMISIYMYQTRLVRSAPPAHCEEKVSCSKEP